MQGRGAQGLMFLWSLGSGASSAPPPQEPPLLLGLGTGGWGMLSYGSIV